MEPGRLRLIRGEAGSGKTRVAAEAARLHEAAGWQVITVAPTGAGLAALEREGVKRPRTMRRFLKDTASGQTSDGEETSPKVPLTPETVIVLDDATRLSGAEMSTLLELGEASGAKVVAMIGGEGQNPTGAGPVIRAVEMRAWSVSLGKDQFRSPGSALALGGILKGGRAAEAAIRRFSDNGELIAGGDRRRVASAVAQSYVADPTEDKIALTWSRADARAVTDAIRARLDKAMPERRQRPVRSQAKPEDDPFGDLKPGDRIRFLRSTPWPPRDERDKGWPSRRLFAGERAEVTGRDPKTGGLALSVTARGGVETREVVIPPKRHEEMPDWSFAFAGTIHGEGALARKSVHLLVSPGMPRQVLAAGVAPHQERLRIVVPSTGKRMGEVLTGIVRRDGKAESVLDYGFDPSLGARAAMRDHAIEAAPEERGIEAAIDRLARLAGIDRSAASEARRPLPREVEGAVLAEVIGAAMAAEGRGAAPLDGKDRLAVERYVRSLSDTRGWRRLLRQVPARLPREADALARAEAGPNAVSKPAAAIGPDTKHGPAGPGRPLMVARYLARGALTARALGEDSVAALFEEGLQHYSQRAGVARAPEVPPPGGVVAAPPAPVQIELPLPVAETGAMAARDAGTASERAVAEPAAPATMSAALPGAGEGAAPEAAAPAAETQDPRRPEANTEDPRRGAAVPEQKASTAPERSGGITAEERALALQLALAISCRVPPGDPVHKGDLPQEIGQLLYGAARIDTDPDTRLALTEARDDLGKGDKALLGALRAALEAGPPEDHETLMKARGEVLAAPDRPATPPPALIDGMAGAFTQSEIWALCSRDEAWPQSLPRLDATARASVSEYLMEEVAARQSARETVPQQSVQETIQMEHQQKEATMDDQARTAAREEALGKLMTGAAQHDTFDRLTKVFSFAELQVLRNPEMALPDSLPDLTASDRQDMPDSLPDLTASDRQDIAATIRAGPPKPEGSGGGRRGGAPAFVPDPKYDGRALQLAAAITERVDFGSPVHRRQDLVADIRALLRAADAAQNLPGDKVNELTKELTDARVTLDAKLALAAVLDGKKFNRPLFLRDVGERNPKPGYHHPMGHAPWPIKNAFTERADQVADEAISRNPASTEAERSVARIAHLPNLPDDTGSLVEALKYVFREGSLKEADDLMEGNRPA